MKLFKHVLYAFIILLSQNTVFAQLVEDTPTNQNQLPPFLTTNSIAYSDSQIEKAYNYKMLTLGDTTLMLKNGTAYPPAKRDYRRLGYASAMYAGTATLAFGLLWVMPESVSNWDKEEIKEKGVLWKWKENVKAGPVWDEDDWVLNWITHPYSGGVYYMTARSSGFTIFESFLYSAFMSTCFWEYGIEAFAEIPSKQDLIITPVLGSVVGEGFFYAKKNILRHDRRVLKSRFLGYTSLLLMDPFNTLLDSFGYKEKIKTQMNVAPVGFDQGTNRTIWGVNLNMQF
ncbi:DUF3943 domain-containing protein [Flavobacterium aquicola]|uniref:Uncharacterized protein DUF3943 n=1 Tax=Flavobacterium aquicola TaxID=1682742 RepID=A0A3E0EGC0_9FLAO|nr:DUF3943 domain-containing protein [Flavobacterium aquicola]REG96116.1 uncharacterized protein DUF3943 [Flavobacterium aquicola]